MKKYIKATLLIALMILIFYLSSQVADESSTTSSVFVEMFFNIYKQLFNGSLNLEEFSVIFTTPIRKLAHFSEFALLGMLSYLNIIEYTSKRTIGLSIILSFIYSITDEVHQYFVPGRYCSIIDIFIDACGAIVGIIFIHLLIKKWKK